MILSLLIKRRMSVKRHLFFVNYQLKIESMTPFEKYQNRYLELILSENWLEEMKIVAKQTLDLYRSFSENEGNFAYEDGKWSLKTLLEIGRASCRERV